MDVRAVFHHEGSEWWAESPELPGLYAAGDRFDEVRRLFREAAYAEFDVDASAISEFMGDAPIVAGSVWFGATVGEAVNRSTTKSTVDGFRRLVQAHLTAVPVTA